MIEFRGDVAQMMKPEFISCRSTSRHLSDDAVEDDDFGKVFTRGWDEVTE